MAQSKFPKSKNETEIGDVPPRTGWVLSFPGFPSLWFPVDSPGRAMLTLAELVRQYRLAHGKVPRGASLAIKQGYEEPVVTCSEAA